MQRIMTFIAAVTLMSCGASPEVELEPSSGKAEDYLANYQTVELQCTRQKGVEGSITDTQTLFEPFSTKVEVRKKDQTVVVKGDLVRLFVPAKGDLEPAEEQAADGPYAQICEFGINTDPLMFLFARRPGESWQVVKAPIDIDYFVSCSDQEVADQGTECTEESCCLLREQDGKFKKKVTLEANLDSFYWFKVIKSYDPDEPAPVDPCSGKTRRVMAHKDKHKHTGKAGLLMGAIPSRMENIEAIEGSSWSIYMDLIFHSAVFVPFEDIPAFQQLTDGPMELAVMGMNRMSVFGDISTSFRYDLYVDCPGCVSQVTDQWDITDNCMLPDTL